MYHASQHPPEAASNSRDRAAASVSCRFIILHVVVSVFSWCVQRVFHAWPWRQMSRTASFIVSSIDLMERRLSFDYNNNNEFISEKSVVCCCVCDRSTVDCPRYTWKAVRSSTVVGNKGSLIFCLHTN